jgi:serine/threonine protein phosphatase PrpC
MHRQEYSVFKAYVQRLRARLSGITNQGRWGGGAIGGDTETTDRRRLVAPADSLCAITDVGRVRDHNEDTFYVSDNGKLLIVADGMGGHEAGEVASALAVEALVEFFTGGCQEMVAAGAEPIETLLREAFETAHRKVLEASRSWAECRGMGTTLILAYVHGNRLYACHVGDVRCYLRTATGMEQITRDHSVVGMLMQAGELTPEQARVHPQKNEILQAIGLSDGIVPEVNSRVLAHGDRILLCSDGLWGTLSDEEIGAIVDWDGSVRQRATQLVDRANDAGGYDNITVVLYEHAVWGEHDEVPGETP